MDINLVQFDHDDRSDLLTGALAPTNFYRALLRAISVRKRNGGALFIITVKVIAPIKSFKGGSPAASRQIKEYEGALINSSKLIKKNLRTQDLFTRMAVNGFYILISGDKSEEPKLVERFKKLFADRSLYEVGASKLIGDSSAAEWLNEIDRSYFTD